MKKSSIVLFVLIAALLIVSCGRADAVKAAENQSQPQQPAAEVQMPESAEEPEKAPAAEPEPAEERTAEQPAAEPQSETQSQGCVVEAGGIKLEVIKATVEKDYLGNDMIVIMLVYRNSNSTGMQYSAFARESATQNGMSLKNDNVVDGEKFYNITKSMSNGQSIPIYTYFELKDANSPVEFTVSICNFEKGTTLATGTCSLVLEK